jgi:hypothetical protein
MIMKILVLESMPTLWVVASPAIQGIYLELQAASSSISASEVLPREQNQSVRVSTPKASKRDSFFSFAG